MDAEEYARRINYRQQVEAYFRKHPNEWIPASALLVVGGRMAWRTRVADARKVFEGEGAVLQNRQTRVDGAILSEYRYLTAAPLARDATTPEPHAFTDSYRSQERLF
jgi:hypothetical protein